MSDILKPASQAAERRWSAMAVGSGKLTSRLLALVALRGLIATWRERTYFQRELMRLLKDNPELIDDIGLTIREVEAEIAKPFWQR